MLLHRSGFPVAVGVFENSLITPNRLREEKRKEYQKTDEDEVANGGLGVR